MADLLNLIETVPGQVTLEVFARKTGRTIGAMRFEIIANEKLARYFCEIVALAMREVPA